MRKVIKYKYSYILQFVLILLIASSARALSARLCFNENWKFNPGEDSLAFEINHDVSGWRNLNLPHDWSIEGMFSQDAACKTDGGALLTGIGWYRKTFFMDDSLKSKIVYIDFDGVYRNSEVWINGHYLGKRPYGYSSFRYELTPWLKFRGEKNVIAVRVDNSGQPNSRWYTGSGIYRNVWLVTSRKIHIAHWGTFVTTQNISSESADINLLIKLRNHDNKTGNLSLNSTIYDEAGKEVANQITNQLLLSDSITLINQEFTISNPVLWSVDRPYLYKIVTKIIGDNTIIDNYETPLGIRFFEFNSMKGFLLNGKPMKILGVCLHHDLGALGAAVNTRAMEYRLELLKAMGCNAIRTAHNPPAPEFLDLCDKMGFIVMDEAFDMWKKKKNKMDYHLDFEKWHRKDLEDMILRDRNHPSIFMWSIGNEIREQFDSTGINYTKELTDIVKNLDTTRPVTCALTENDPEKNYIYKSEALDLLSFNYKLDAYHDFPKLFPNQKFIAAENVSALATRGHYDLPSDSIRHWPKDSKAKFVENGNADWTVSAYDNVSAYWGSTHEETWNVVKKFDFISGYFVWSGFDFLGEPVPYSWPARSSYYGIIDMAGFPKDAYYFYQSEWTKKPVLHLFPHWNLPTGQAGWGPGKIVDVWAYYNNADEAELFLNDKSLGTRHKLDSTYHVMWRVPFKPGTLKVISRKNGKIVLTREIKTAGDPYKIELTSDRDIIKSDGCDLSFVTVKITDKEGNMVPNADNLVNFKVKGEGFIAGVDNGYQASLEPFKANYRKAYNGMCMCIIQSNGKKGKIMLKANSEGLKPTKITISTIGY